MFNKMYDIITFGSATQDIRLKSNAFKVLKDKEDFATGEGLCLALGSKINVEEIDFTSGGGGTNVAATFAKQGLKTAFCGAVGNDVSGAEIIKELQNLKVDTNFVVIKKEKHTNHSIIVFNEGEDRTILAYRGASELLTDNDILWNKLKTKWIYLAPMTGLLLTSPKSADEGGCGFEKLINFAFKNKIKVAMNPSMQQLSLPESVLKNILSKVDILFLNQEEASFLTKINFTDEVEIFKKIDELCPGVAVMTKGGNGVAVSDGKYFYSANPNPNREIVDTTGAGDAFASGFLAEFIKYNGDIEKAIQFGMANSEANLSKVGAKTGLLEKNSKIERVQVAKQLCTENNLCLPK
jgi:ribokinase